jgi:hypothetical protein
MPIPAGYVSGQVIQAVVGVGKILQVVSTTKTNTFSSAVTAFTDVTGLSVTITPSSATSTILVMADVSTYHDASAASAWARLVRGSTGVYLGDAAGSRTQASHMIGWASGSNTGTPIFMTFVDSPATTSATTYKVQVGNQSGTTYVNRTGGDVDSAVYPRTASSITVMEISA